MFYRNTAINELFNSLAILDSNKYNRRSRQYQTNNNDDGVTLTIETPGYNKNLIDVNVKDNLLVVEGKSNSGDTKGFKEHFTLDDTLDSNSIKATIVDGILSVNIPYKEETKSRKVKVKVG